jgi:hypothetical protein
MPNPASWDHPELLPIVCKRVHSVVLFCTLRSVTNRTLLAVATRIRSEDPDAWFVCKRVHQVAPYCT